MTRHDGIFGTPPVAFLTAPMMAAAILLIAAGELAWAADPIKLNGPLVAGGNVWYEGLQFSPDSSRVLYRADQTTDEVYELYSVPSTGGTAVKLNSPLVAGGDVWQADFQFSPDSSRVLYRADQDTDDVYEIYSVLSTGGAAVKLNGPLVAGGTVLFNGAQFSPDSSRVLYRADQTTDGVVEIFSVPSAGGTPIKLNGPLVAGGDVFSSGLFSPDSSRVLYLADQDADQVDEIFSVPSTGGTPVKLNGSLVTGGDVFHQGAQISPDSSRVLYRADQDTDDVVEIYSVPSSGGRPVKLSGTLVPGGSVSSGNLQFRPDSGHVLYRADQETEFMYEIFSVPSIGGTPVKLNGPLVAGGDVTFQQFSPDSKRVLYRADQDTDEVYEIYSVPSVGGTPVKLNGPLVTGGDVSSNLIGPQFSPDSKRVLYSADQDTDDVFEIYSVPAGGGTPTKLNGPLVPGGDVSFNGLHFSPDSSRVLYYADQDTDGVGEIFLVPSTGGTAVKLNGPLVAGGSVTGGTSYRFSPDGSLVLYHADQDTDGVYEAYVRIVRQHSIAGAGNWDAGAAWDHGGEPDEVMQVFVDAPGEVTVSGVGLHTVNELVVGGGAGTSTLALAAGASVKAMHGATIQSDGFLRGDGLLTADLLVADGGLVRTAAGERLVIRGASVSNAGSVEALGAAHAPAEIEFYGVVTTSAGTGRIIARDATLRFDGGLTNKGELGLIFGDSDVWGEVTNNATGAIVVAGNIEATFHDDVTNSGSLDVAGGSTAVFIGSLAGNGNGGSGDVQALGDLLPGASPGTMLFGGDLDLGPQTSLEIELGGLTAGSQFDQLVVAGDATLAGALNVSLIEGFSLLQGYTFKIVDIGDKRIGAFHGLAEGAMVGTFGSEELFITYAGGDGNDVALFVPGLPGDYNADGVVDAADYTVWRDNVDGAPGTLPNDTAGGEIGPAQYSLWRASYGASLPAPSPVENAAVPEPAAGMLAAMLLVLTAMGVRPTRRPA